MSKNVPKRGTHGKPGASSIPDVVVVHDPTRPPTQDNIKKIYEIKFGDDEPAPTQMMNYGKIAGGAPVEVLRPEDCGCDSAKSDPLPAEISAREAAEIVLLTLWVLAMIVDDAAPGGQADDVLIPGVLGHLLTKLAPILSKLRPVFPPMLPVP